MNNAQTADFFSARRQFARVMAADVRTYRTDLLYGLFYSLIGFFLVPQPGGRSGVPNELFAPFISAGVAMAFLTYRVCSAERTPRTADLYFNLPRSRAVAWAAHMTLLAGVALALDGVILLGARLRLNLPPEAMGFHVLPLLPALPLMGLAVAAWMVYLMPHWIWQVAVILPLVVLFPFFMVVSLLKDREARTLGALGLNHGIVATLALLGVAGLLLAHSRHAWLKRQIGAHS